MGPHVLGGHPTQAAADEALATALQDSSGAMAGGCTAVGSTMDGGAGELADIAGLMAGRMLIAG